MFNIQHSTLNTQHSTFNTQHSTLNIPNFFIAAGDNSTFKIQNSKFFIIFAP